MKKIGLLGKLILGILAGTVSGKNPFKCIKNYLPAYFTALGTQSSAATIPVSMECARKNEISEEVVDFVVPLGEVSTGLCPEPLKHGKFLLILKENKHFILCIISVN